MAEFNAARGQPKAPYEADSGTRAMSVTRVRIGVRLALRAEAVEGVQSREGFLGNADNQRPHKVAIGFRAVEARRVGQGRSLLLAAFRARSRGTTPASAYPSRMLAFTPILGHLENVG
jgi:hypothetical protein